MSPPKLYTSLRSSSQYVKRLIRNLYHCSSISKSWFCPKARTQLMYCLTMVGFYHMLTTIAVLCLLGFKTTFTFLLIPLRFQDFLAPEQKMVSYSYGLVHKWCDVFIEALSPSVRLIKSICVQSVSDTKENNCVLHSVHLS